MVRSSEPINVTEDSLGRDEMNLAELPISLLSNREPKDCGPLVFETRHGRLTITSPSGTRAKGNGLPTAADTDVLIGLLQLTKRTNDFTDPTVNFSRYELLRIIRWPDEGKSYRRLKESLKRWVKVTLEYEGSWFDNHDQIRCDNTVNILSEAHVFERYGRSAEGERGQDGMPASRICWAPTFFQSCRANYLKRLDLDVYFGLSSPTTKQLYRFLDKRFYRRPTDPLGETLLTRTFDLRELALGHVGMSPNYTIPRIKEKLALCLEELEAIGFIEKVTKEDRYTKTGHGKWDITFKKRARDQKGSTLPALHDTVPENPLAKDLISRGVTPVTAMALVRNFPAEAVANKLEVFDWLIARKDKRVSKNPAGFLAKSIRDDFANPKGFETKAQVDAKRLVAEKAEQEARARKAESRVQDAKLRVKKEAVDAYLSSLTPEQRVDLEREAHAESELDVKLFGRIIVRDHVGKLLGFETEC